MTGRFWAFCAVLLLLMPCVAQAQFVDLASSPTYEAKDAVGQLLFHWSLPNAQALPAVQSAMSDPVTFYGKPLSREAYMQAQEAFANRWPQRQYGMEPSSETVSCDEEGSTCDVSGIEYWNDFSPSRHVTSTGSAKVSFSLHATKNTAGKTVFLITAVSGSVVSSAQNQAVADGPDMMLGAPAGGNFASPSANSAGQPQLVTDAALQLAGCPSIAGPIQHENCQSLEEIDVTKAFHTKDRTVFEIIQANFNQATEDAPTMSYCFVHRDRMQCRYGVTDSDADRQDWLSDAEVFQGASIIYPTTGAYYPLLLANLSVYEGMGCGGLFNFVWAYDPASDMFKLLWAEPYDCHTTLQFESTGPLAGDMVAVDNDVTGRWPWLYGIEVYRFVPPDRLDKLLYMVGKAGQGGKFVTGPVDAISTDMPEILRRLGQSN